MLFFRSLMSLSDLYWFLLFCGFFPKFCQVMFQLSLFSHHVSLELPCSCFVVFVGGFSQPLVKWFFMVKCQYCNLAPGSISSASCRAGALCFPPRPAPSVLSRTCRLVIAELSPSSPSCSISSWLSSCAAVAICKWHWRIISEWPFLSLTGDPFPDCFWGAFLTSATSGSSHLLLLQLNFRCSSLLWFLY